jgi:hypothetical protein
MAIRGLDEYIAGGHYHKFWVSLRCPYKTCGLRWESEAYSEYGATDYARPNCPDCGTEGVDD